MAVIASYSSNKKTHRRRNGGCAQKRSNQPKGKAQLTFGQRKRAEGAFAASVRHTHNAVTVGHDILLKKSASQRNGQRLSQRVIWFRANRHAPTPLHKLRIGRQSGKVSKALRRNFNDGKAHHGDRDPVSTADAGWLHQTGENCEKQAESNHEYR